LHAFRAAFPHGQTDAILAIKLLAIKLLAGSYNPSAEEQHELFSTDPAFGDDVILIIEAFTDSEMTELVRCCDAFVSLHRAEGFGLGAAEAMSLGKPVIVTEFNAVPGTVGDIVLGRFADDYTTIDKGGVQYATSIHVQFLTDQTAFRFIYLYDGQPTLNGPVTPYKGSNTQSAYVALETRA
jgi:glycosyltransferase involved in cell wall biosynthesis